MTLYLPYALAVWLFIVGIFGIIRSRNVIHAVLCLAVVQSSTYVLLIAIGFKRNASAPIFSADVPVGTPSVDSVVHALTLTDIVVATVVTALIFTMAIQVYRQTGTLDPEKLRPMRG
jgi:multicomponent Na+:H+ antiporter subunit C